MKKKVLFFVAALILVFSIRTSYSEKNIDIYVNGKLLGEMKNDIVYISQNNKVMVPLRFVSENIGLDVKYDSKTQEILISEKTTNTNIRMKTNSTKYFKNDKAFNMSVLPEIKNGTTYLPLRDIAELFDSEVEWLQNEKTVKITTKSTGSVENKEQNAPVNTSQNNKINNFSYRTFNDILANNDLKKNLVYSPYSYIGALGTLRDFTDSFDNHTLIKEIKGVNAEINNPMLQSESVFLLSDEFKEVSSQDKRLKLVSFPEKAQDESKALQRKVLNEVLSNPNYDGLNAVIVNASRFLGYWEYPFDSQFTEKADFTTVNGSKMKVDMMKQYLEPSEVKGYQDKNVKVVRMNVSDNKDQALSTQKGYVYIVKPELEGLSNEQKEKAIKDTAKNLGSIMNNMENSKKPYKVDLKVPKIKIKTTTDLTEKANEANYPFSGAMYFNRNLNKAIDQSFSIDKIQQVAQIEMNEEKIEAKAVTEILLTTTSIPNIVEPELLILHADSPYFIVITAQDSENSNPQGREYITFVSYVAEPTIE